MISAYPSGQSTTHTFELVDGEGLPVAAASATYKLLDEKGDVVLGETSIVIGADPSILSVTIAGNLNIPSAGEIRGFRSVEVKFKDDNNLDHIASVDYVIEEGTSIITGFNSFATFGTLMMIAVEMPELAALLRSPKKEQKAALLNAWYNIGNLKMRFSITDEAGSITSSSDLGIDELARLDMTEVSKLTRAQVVEANAILGGNPVEDRRRMGLISDSAGESTHFFRTSKPLELPIAKATATALSGLIDWSVNIGRS